MRLFAHFRSTPGTAQALACALLSLLAYVNVAAPTPVSLSRYIVSFDASVQPDEAWLAEHAPDIHQKSYGSIQWLRRTSGNGRVLQVSGTFEQRSLLLNVLRKHPHIHALAYDSLVTPTQANTPNDPLFDDQWQLQDDVLLAGSIDAVNAWNITQGSSDTVIAVIDTGVRPEHPDLAGRLLPGYDFVSGFNEALNGDDPFPSDLIFARSNDGDGRDPDPTDPGDGLDAELAQRLNDVNVRCDAANSTWHGTGVASLIAANANDGVGLTGVDWNAMILPVRAIGRCGGHRSDLLDAIRWAAGVDDPALPPNPTPAHIINLSLGMNDSCAELDQAAINDAVGAGAIVVTAVGNQGRDTADHPSSPAQCEHVIGVAATDEIGYLASYSNFGRDADIAAPGGLSLPSQFGVNVATNAGVIAESQEQTWKSVSGTSVAAPMVSGTLGLMRSLQPELNTERLTQLLLDSATPFPQAFTTRFALPCDRALCGSGLLNTHNAVRNALEHVPSEADTAEITFDDQTALTTSADAILSPINDGENIFGCSIAPRGAQSGLSVQSRIDPTLILIMLAALTVYHRRKWLKPTHVPV